MYNGDCFKLLKKKQQKFQFFVFGCAAVDIRNPTNHPRPFPPHHINNDSRQVHWFINFVFGYAIDTLYFFPHFTVFVSDNCFLFRYASDQDFICMIIENYYVLSHTIVSTLYYSSCCLSVRLFVFFALSMCVSVCLSNVSKQFPWIKLIMIMIVSRVNKWSQNRQLDLIFFFIQKRRRSLLDAESIWKFFFCCWINLVKKAHKHMDVHTFDFHLRSSWLPSVLDQRHCANCLPNIRLYRVRVKCCRRHWLLVSLSFKYWANCRLLTEICRPVSLDKTRGGNILTIMSP